MSKARRKFLSKCAIALAAGLLLSLGFTALRVDVTNLPAVPAEQRYLVLCDAFTVPGLLMLFFALMLSISNMGALDGVGYVVVTAVKMLIPGAAVNKERYSDYLERRKANRAKGYGFLYVCALINLAVAAVFLILFYSVYEG